MWDRSFKLGCIAENAKQPTIDNFPRKMSAALSEHVHDALDSVALDSLGYRTTGLRMTVGDSDVGRLGRSLVEEALCVQRNTVTSVRALLQVESDEEYSVSLWSDVRLSQSCER